MSGDVVVKLVRPDKDQAYIDDARAVLQEAIDMKLHSVVVFGLDADGWLITRNSKNRDRLEVMGALEAAKPHLWDS